MIVFDKPTNGDLVTIKKILEYWTDPKDTEIYLNRIANEINGKTEFNLHFWVVRSENIVVGLEGLCDPLPSILNIAKTNRPGELKILHLNNDYRGKGIGKKFIGFLEIKAKEFGYKEMLIRSASKYKDTAYGFYEKMGYKNVGQIFNQTDPNPMQVFEKLLL